MRLQASLIDRYLSDCALRCHPPSVSHPRLELVSGPFSLLGRMTVSIQSLVTVVLHGSPAFNKCLWKALKPCPPSLRFTPLLPLFLPAAAASQAAAAAAGGGRGAPAANNRGAAPGGGLLGNQGQGQLPGGGRVRVFRIRLNLAHLWRLFLAAALLWGQMESPRRAAMVLGAIAVFQILNMRWVAPLRDWAVTAMGETGHWIRDIQAVVVAFLASLIPGWPLDAADLAQMEAARAAEENLVREIEDQLQREEEVEQQQENELAQLERERGREVDEGEMEGIEG